MWRFAVRQYGKSGVIAPGILKLYTRSDERATSWHGYYRFLAKESQYQFGRRIGDLQNRPACCGKDSGLPLMGIEPTIFQLLRRLVSSVMLRRVALVRTDVWRNLAPPSSGWPILVTLMKALSSSETSVVTRAIQRNIPEDTILHSHLRENLKSYIPTTSSVTIRHCATKYHPIAL
jgi:hypothetical protein